MWKVHWQALNRHIFQFCCTECRHNWIFFHELDLWRNEEGFLIVHEAQTCVPLWLISEDELQNTELNTKQVCLTALLHPRWAKSTAKYSNLTHTHTITGRIQHVTQSSFIHTDLSIVWTICKYLGQHNSNKGESDAAAFLHKDGLI